MLRAIAAGLLVLLPYASPAWADPPQRTWFAKAPALAEAQGVAKQVSTVDELYRAVDEAGVGTTIFLADGDYSLPSVLNIQADGVILRSRSGDRHRVVLDGKKCRGGELVLIRGKRCTIADITIANVKWNGFKIAAELGAQEATIYNCVIHNVWQRGVKASHIPPDKPELYPRGCRVQFCLFYNDRPKEFADDETDTADNFNGNYIGGIDAKNTIGWTISDNVFMGLQGRTREGRGAVYISEEGRDCVIERNVIVDCDVGIALGNPSRGGDWLHAIGCTVRNNFVTRCPESGILACYT